MKHTDTQHQSVKKSAEKLDGIRHSLAHILAAAVKEKFPKVQLGIGPVIDNGFYYDFKFPKEFSEEMLPELENRMRAIIRQNLAFTGKKVMPAQAKKFMKDQKFKLELIDDFKKDKKPLTIYKTGDIFMDLCKGGHVKNTREIDPDGFTLSHIAGAYWKGNEKNAQLTRIYGLAFASKADLDAYRTMMAEAEKRDHKKLGKEMKLFVFSPSVGPGLPLYAPRGMMLRTAILDYITKIKLDHNYSFVWTPHLAKEALYIQSGHLGKYDAMLPSIDADGDKLVIKPMNCPHHFQIYNAEPHSYKDLPLRIAENATVYRDEKSGELNGLLRVRSLTQDDTHHVVRHDQIAKEIDMIIKIIHDVYKVFGFKDYRASISVRDPKNKKKYFGNDKTWKEAEGALVAAATRWNIPHFIAEGEAAFYGPKIDFVVKDAIGREWQLTTIQLDYVQPENFDMTYTDETGTKVRPAVLHVAVLGSIDRFLAIVIEHFAGAFPLWLAPEQVRILAVSEKFEGYCLEVRDALRARGIRATLAESNETLGKRIRESDIQKVPYSIIVGEKEVAAKTVNVRQRGAERGTDRALSLEQFVGEIEKEIAAKA